MTVSDKYDTRGCPVIDNTCHVEITKMEPIEIQESVFIRILKSKIWIIEISTALWSCKKKKPPPKK